MSVRACGFSLVALLSAVVTGIAASDNLAEHVVLFEPAGTELMVSERYVLNTSAKGNTFRFYAPPESRGIQVNKSAALPTGEPHIYKVDFPFEAGVPEIVVTYVLPFDGRRSFAGKVLAEGASRTLLVMRGGQLKGDGLVSRGQGPSGTSIYQIDKPEYEVEIAAEPEQSGAQLQFVMPRIYERMEWLLALSFSILMLGFVMLCRSESS